VAKLLPGDYLKEEHQKSRVSGKHRARQDDIGRRSGIVQNEIGIRQRTNATRKAWHLQ
jgi:hypothetical protein